MSLETTSVIRCDVCGRSTPWSGPGRRDKAKGMPTGWALLRIEGMQSYSKDGGASGTLHVPDEGARLPGSASDVGPSGAVSVWGDVDLCDLCTVGTAQRLLHLLTGTDQEATASGSTEAARGQLLATARRKWQAARNVAASESAERRAYLQGRYDEALEAGAVTLGMDPLEFERLVQQ